jgi:hypothetical protein
MPDASAWFESRHPALLCHLRAAVTLQKLDSSTLVPRILYRLRTRPLMTQGLATHPGGRTDAPALNASVGPYRKSTDDYPQEPAGTGNRLAY